MSETTERLPEIVRLIQRLLEQGAVRELVEVASALHPSDLADVLENLDGDRQRLRLLEVLPAPLVSEALAEMEDEEHPADLLLRLDPRRIAELVEELSDDDAADLIGELEPDEQARVLVGVEDADEILELLEYEEDSAGGIMTRELVSVSYDATAGEAIEQLRSKAADGEEFYTIFVVDPDQRLRGIVNLRSLVLASPSTPIGALVEEPVAVVPVDMDQEEVGRILSRYNLASIGVVDPRGRLVGRITFDDVIDVVEAETTEDILRFAAVDEEEALRGTTLGAVRSRLPWLAVNLVTASLGATVVYLFQDTIEQAVILASLMPVIAGMGGNAGTQALAVTVRRIAVSDETLVERWSVIGKELRVGLINGFAIGALLAAIGLLLPESRPMLGAVVMIAMWGNLILASTLGAFFPILLESIGVDPAVASSIFVTACTDLSGFLLLLGLGTALLL